MLKVKRGPPRMAIMRKLISLALAGVLAAALGLTFVVSRAVAKKGADDAKAEVGTDQDDRGRHGRSNGENGRITDGTNGSGKSGNREGYDRLNGSGVAASGSTRRRDEMDRF